LDDVSEVAFCRAIALAIALTLFDQHGVGAQVLEGMALFTQHCASCHQSSPTGSTGDAAPRREALGQRTAESILQALTDGPMAPNATALSAAQKRTVAEYVAGRPIGALASGHAAAMKNRCARKSLTDISTNPSWNGWGSDVTNSRFQSARNAGVSADQVPRLALKWAFAFPNATSAYGQPTVAGGRIFVGSENGFLYALDAATGCVHWSFEAEAGIRTAVSVGQIEAAGGRRIAIYFGDVKANVYALDAETGEALWTRHADTHPMARITGTPVLYESRLYVPVSSLEEAVGATPTYECCTFRGSLVVYDARTGHQIWKSYTISEPAKPLRKTRIGTQLWGPSGVAIWSAPTIDVSRKAVYVATGDAYTEPAPGTSDAVLAFSLTNGELLWSQQALPDDAWLLGCGVSASRAPVTRKDAKSERSENCPEKLGPDMDFGSSPILQPLSAGRTMLVIGQKNGMAWGLDPDRKGAVVWQRAVGGGIQWGSAADDRLAYFPNPLTALDPATGKPVWQTRVPAQGDSADATPNRARQAAAITTIPGVVFSGSTDGMMRDRQRCGRPGWVDERAWAHRGRRDALCDVRVFAHWNRTTRKRASGICCAVTKCARRSSSSARPQKKGP
jgi:polyvinyl alcohol dehydrogenase (cytochrome)